MRVKLQQRPVKQGLLFKTTFYEVACTVLFTHEELQILRQMKLLKTKLLDRRPATARVDDRDDKFVLHVNDLVNGKTDRHLLANPADAKYYEQALLAALQQLKLWIGDNADVSEDLVVEL